MAEGPRALDGVTEFLGLRWVDPRTVHLTIRPDLINAGGMLSGVVAYALVDYSMGSALWEHTSDAEAIATISISITYLRTATEGHIVCRTQLDRRTRATARDSANPRRQCDTARLATTRRTQAAGSS